VTLLGDAASCVSLFGDGSSSAMEGAATLAAFLAASPRDIPSALARYESAHRAVTRPRQRGIWVASHLLIPRSQLEMTLRDRVLRLTGR
jgi:2-polyprenyl-6-methoxyphenol hydroxylase-like FAD-dependent oxidoreductase